MSATHTTHRGRLSRLVLVCSLAAIIALCSTTVPPQVRADGHPIDTIEYPDTTGSGVGKSYEPPTPDPTVAPNDYLDEARELITELAAVVRTIWI